MSDGEEPSHDEAHASKDDREESDDDKSALYDETLKEYERFTLAQKAGGIPAKAEKPVKRVNDAATTDTAASC